jgi:hypothetical protein
MAAEQVTGSARKGDHCDRDRRYEGHPERRPAAGGKFLAAKRPLFGHYRHR